MVDVVRTEDCLWVQGPGSGSPRADVTPVPTAGVDEAPDRPSAGVLRVGGLDTAFLSCETPGVHMHVGGLLLLEPSAPASDPYDTIRSLLLDALPKVPFMHKRLAWAPFGVGRPFWVDDDEFDIDRHLHRVPVPTPGDDRALARFIGEVASRPLRRDRPLWEVWVVDGLPAGQVALLAKMHHAIVDGVTGVSVMGRLFAPSPPWPESPESAATWRPEPGPGALHLLGLGLLDGVRAPLEVSRLLPVTTGRLAATAWNLGSRRRRAGIRVTPFSAPRTSFNATLTSRRSVAVAEVSLADVKVVKNAFGVKVNDVIAAVVGGVLRRYLRDRGELPARPLVAAQPVAVHTHTGARSGVSKLSVIFSTLGTDVADPVERLRVVAASNARAKDVSRRMGADTFTRWTELAPPGPLALGARAYSKLHGADHLPVVFNVLVSNVAGPPVELSLAGNRIVGAYAFGPIVDGAALNVTVLSTGDRIGFGITSCPDLVPDVWRLADDVPHALCELVKATSRASRVRRGAPSAARQRGALTHR